jgi:hypothetical protein
MVVTKFVGIIPIKPLRDFTHPVEMPRGLKDLLHTLNAIIHPMKDRFILLIFSLFDVLYS